MTALKPIENVTNVRGMPSERYPLNTICAHPECGEPVESAHHIFGRPRGPHSSSWFVAIDLDPRIMVTDNTIPHVTGLCGSGTTGHHGDVEEHRAWIKYEDEVYVWYQEYGPNAPPNVRWEQLGPLNPQPGSREGKTKKAKSKRRTLNEQERRLRVNLTIKVPADKEEGAGLWDDQLAEIKAALIEDGLYDSDDNIPQYEAWMAQSRDWLDRRKAKT